LKSYTVFLTLHIGLSDVHMLAFTNANNLDLEDQRSQKKRPIKSSHGT